MQRIWAIFRITLKRLWAQRGLNLAILLALVAAVALANKPAIVLADEPTGAGFDDLGDGF